MILGMETNDLINQFLSVITTWQQAGVVAGLIVLVNLLTNVAKLEFIAKRVPAAVLPWIAVGLGGLGGFFLALSAGKPLAQAVVAGIIAGLGAIGTHELVKSSKPVVKAAARKLSGHPAMALIIISATSVIVLSSCHGECAKPENAASLKCTVVNSVLDCTVPELKSAVEAFLPIALGYVDKIKNPDGSIEWDVFADKLAASGRADAMCIFERTVGVVIAVAMKAGPSPTPHVDPGLQRERALEARIKRFGNIKVKTAEGVQ
jgi:hypothetical protein